MREANANTAIDSKPGAPKRRASNSSCLWLIVLLAAAAAILCYRAVETRVQRELRVAVFKRLQETFPQARIALSRVTIEGPDRIAVHGLKIGALDNRRVRSVLTADRIELSGDLDIAHCIQETVRIQKIDVYRPEVNLWKMQNGQWSWTVLACVSKPNQPTPKVSLQHGELKVHSGVPDASSFVQFHTISGIVAESTSVTHGKNALESKFTADCGYCESLSLSGFIDREKGQIVLGGTIEELNFSADLAAKLPPDATALMTKLSGLNCKASALFRVQRNGPEAPWTFGVEGKLTKGRLNDRQLPYPLDDLSGNFFCDNQSLKLREVKARSGQTVCTLDADIHGFSAQSPVTIRAAATDLQLDTRLYNALPTKWRTYWDRVKPDGIVDAMLVLKSDGKSWTPLINVHCRDVQLECWLFPYPLTDVHGQVVLRLDSLMGKGLYGKAGGQPISSNFQFQRIEDEWFGNLNITGSGPITIDDKVLSALTTRGQPTSNVERFVRSLTPSGTFQIDKANFKKIYGEPAYWHKELAISVNDCSMLYRGFQYPLHRISGRIEATDDEWKLIGFEGWNGTGRIQCNGGWQDRRAEGVPFQLAFTAHGLPLQEELFTALPPDARQLWEQLEPSGSIDRAEISLKRGTGNDAPDLTVALHEDIHTGSTAGQSLRLQPKAFPYLLSDVACDLTYRPGLLEISQASANNSSIRAAIRARCEKNAAGNWAGTVQWLPQSRVTVDTPLLRALPDSISAGLVKLDMRGPVHILGETRFELPFDGVTTPTTELDLSLELEEVQLGDGRNVDNIRGNIRLRGRRDPSQLVATGLANIESMTVRNVPLANVRGPWAIIGNQFLFGSEVAARFQPGPENIPTDITASALAGTLVASGSGQLDTGRFQLKSRLTEADFRCMLQDLGATTAPTDALCNMELAISGVPWEPQTYSGNGAIHLRDAKLYELPIMIRVLRALSVAPTDKAAFHTADIKFDIDGDQIPLELECNGDLLSLKGSGKTNFRKDLDLEVYSYVGGRVPVSSVFAPIVRKASYASLMSFHVSGTIDNPQLGRATFQQLNMVPQIFPDKLADTDTAESSGRLIDRLRR